MRSTLLRTTLAVAVPAACAILVGCSGADNPKMPDIPPQDIKADTAVPKSAPGSQPYGVSKKYQDMMTRDK